MVARKPVYELGATRTAALIVLLDRAGGSMSFTEADYQAAVERYGGKTNLVVHVDVLGVPGQKPNEARVSLLRKPPGAGELPA